MKALYFGSWLFGCNAGNSSDFTLVFEDAQVVPPFSREETNDLDNADGTNDKDDTEDTAQCNTGP